jgi:hypothetical protein
VDDTVRRTAETKFVALTESEGEARHELGAKSQSSLPSTQIEDQDETAHSSKKKPNTRGQQQPARGTREKNQRRTWSGSEKLGSTNSQWKQHWTGILFMRRKIKALMLAAVSLRE